MRSAHPNRSGMRERKAPQEGTMAPTGVTEARGQGRGVRAVRSRIGSGMRGAATRDTAIRSQYKAVRSATSALAANLSAEDQMVQSMPDASPTKWHQAHTTWFFETFVLAPNVSGYRTYADRYGYLFNSYYEAVGPRHARPARGMITRPGIAEIADYRAYVDEAVLRLLDDDRPNVASLIELG